MADKNPERTDLSSVQVKSVRYGKTAAKDARPPVFYAFLEGERDGEQVDFIAYNTTALSTVEVLRDLLGETAQTPHPGSLRDGSYFKGDVAGSEIVFDFKDCVRKEREGQVIHNFKAFEPGYTNTIVATELEWARQQYLEALQAAYQGKKPSQEIDIAGDEHDQSAEIEPEDEPAPDADPEATASDDTSNDATPAAEQEPEGSEPEEEAPAVDATEETPANEAETSEAEAEADEADAPEATGEPDTEEQTAEDAPAATEEQEASNEAEDLSFGGEEDSPEDYQSRDVGMEDTAEQDPADETEAKPAKAMKRLGRRNKPAASTSEEKPSGDDAPTADAPKTEEPTETETADASSDATAEKSEPTETKTEAPKPAPRKLKKLGLKRPAGASPSP